MNSPSHFERALSRFAYDMIHQAAIEQKTDAPLRVMAEHLGVGQLTLYSWLDDPDYSLPVEHVAKIARRLGPPWGARLIEAVSGPAYSALWNYGLDIKPKDVLAKADDVLGYCAELIHDANRDDRQIEDDSRAEICRMASEAIRALHDVLRKIGEP